MAKASKHPLSGEDILRFLRSFEGAAATFAQNEERWTLWLPEMASDDHPLTPASQVFFPVILRHAQQAIAIRFLYDCSSGKVHYYTSAIPNEIARLPEFENAVSELFRHSLPVEPMRERKLGRGISTKPRKPEKLLKPRTAAAESLAEPLAGGASALLVPIASVPLPAPAVADAGVALALPPAPQMPPPAREGHRTFRVEIGPRARGVLMAFIFAVAVVALTAIGIYAYLQATEDPGVLHHKLQIEEMRLREGR